jgi:hypothetical protein
MFFLQKVKGYKTPLLLDAKIFRPSEYFVLTHDENSIQSAREKISAFVEKNKLNFSADEIQNKLQSWLKIFDEYSPRKKAHLTAVHLYKDGNDFKMTLRDNGKRFNYNSCLEKYSADANEKIKFKYALGLNNIYLTFNF